MKPRQFLRPRLELELLEARTVPAKLAGWLSPLDADALANALLN